jgi:hypothetical protein
MEELGRVVSTLAKGARQLVVQLALDTISRSSVYLSSFTPMTNIGASLLGAEITTFFAPPCNYPSHRNTSKHWKPNPCKIVANQFQQPVSGLIECQEKLPIIIQLHLIAPVYKGPKIQILKVHKSSSASKPYN